MSIYELNISWATSARELRRLRWELTAAEEVSGVFVTSREDVLAVMYTGARAGFDALAITLEQGALE
jgi:hypothetical protein